MYELTCRNPPSPSAPPRPRHQAFFFLEAIVGYSVGSLALVADSFHMLNDVMSLIVALYALKVGPWTWQGKGCMEGRFTPSVLTSLTDHHCSDSSIIFSTAPARGEHDPIKQVLLRLATS